MKKLIIKIGDEKHELPYNGETFSFEVEEKYVPKEGDCVMIRPKGSNILYWCKLTSVSTKTADFKILVDSRLEISKKGFFNISYNRVYTKITQEELKAKYAEAGYDWDYESDTIKRLKWMPKDGDFVWYLLDDLTIVNGFYNDDLYYLLEKGLLFPTEAECQKFAYHCLKYFDKK